MASSRLKVSSWDVVVLPFPYSDRLAEKRRPALIVSADRLHRGHKLVWVAMITSAKNSRWSCDVPIVDLSRAGLPAPSVVRPAKIACIEPERIARKLGVISTKEAQAVAAALGQFMART